MNYNQQVTILEDIDFVDGGVTDDKLLDIENDLD